MIFIVISSLCLLHSTINNVLLKTRPGSTAIPEKISVLSNIAVVNS